MWPLTTIRVWTWASPGLWPRPLPVAERLPNSASARPPPRILGPGDRSGWGAPRPPAGSRGASPGACQSRPMASALPEVGRLPNAASARPPPQTEPWRPVWRWQSLPACWGASAPDLPADPWLVGPWSFWTLTAGRRPVLGASGRSGRGTTLARRLVLGGASSPVTAADPWPVGP